MRENACSLECWVGNEVAGVRVGGSHGRRLRSGRGLAVLAGLIGAGAVAAASGVAWRPAIEPVATPARESFGTGLVRQGAVLAAAGFCTTCHSAVDGKPFAGGRPLETPFGTIWGTNITPDRDTGIGTWSLEAFRRSMREGVDREGRHLYPAFPYDHYTQLVDGDIEAIYAYLMTREPIRADTPAPDLPFPYDVRLLLAGWKLLFLRGGPVAPAAGVDPVLERGRYLSEGLAHCSACHAPRNALGAERADKHYAGGEAEGWWSPPLDRSSPAPVPWTEESLFNYLRSWDSQHGGAVGPMKPVVAGLAQLPPEDVRAIARYIVASLGPPSPDRQARTEAIIARAGPIRTDPAIERGGAVYRGACATCHESGATVPFTVRSLAQHTTLAGPDPRNVIRVVLHGVQPDEGEVGAIMPAFAGTLTAGQVGDLMAYLRARYTDEPAWPDIAGDVGRIAGERPVR